MVKYKGLSRIWHHLIIPPWRVGSYFSPAGLSQIEAAITEAELTHKGEIRFVVECSLDNSELFRNVTAKARAIEVFSHIHMWDTEHNNGQQQVNQHAIVMFGKIGRASCRERV